MSDFEAGQILDDARVWVVSSGQLTRRYVFATLIENTDSVDLSAGFTRQQVSDTCPKCGGAIDILIMSKSSIGGKRVLCFYCADCPLLFSSACIGKVGWDGEFILDEEYK